MAAVESKQLETGVVGAGPATLSAAIRLVDLCRERGIDPPEIIVIEKASEMAALHRPLRPDVFEK